MKTVVQGIKTQIRAALHGVARFLDKLTSGRITPTQVTIFGTLMHLQRLVRISNKL
jgi:hypothetical protein